MRQIARRTSYKTHLTADMLWSSVKEQRSCGLEPKQGWLLCGASWRMSHHRHVSQALSDIFTCSHLWMTKYYCLGGWCFPRTFLRGLRQGMFAPLNTVGADWVKIQVATMPQCFVWILRTVYMLVKSSSLTWGCISAQTKRWEYGDISLAVALVDRTQKQQQLPTVLLMLVEALLP